MTAGQVRQPLTLFAMAMMTLLSVLRLLLMACVSFSRAPSDPESFNLSLPARSTKFNVPVNQEKEIKVQNTFKSSRIQFCKTLG